MLVSGSYFSLLGLRPAAGRLLDPNDDRVDGEASAVVLSHAYWQSAFGADPGVVGRTLVVNGKPLTIVGVGAARVPRHDGRRAAAGVRADHVPLARRPRAVPGPRQPQELLGLFVRALEARRFARASGRGDQRAVSGDHQRRRCAAAHGLSASSKSSDFAPRRSCSTPGERGQSRIDDNARTPLTILLVSTALVLLIASVNVANLLLARGSTRVGEIAVRASLGASRPAAARVVARRGAVARGRGRAREPAADVRRACAASARMLPESARRRSISTLDATVVARHDRARRRLDARVRVDPRAEAHARRGESRAAIAAARGKRAAKPPRVSAPTLTTAQIALSMALLVLAGWFAQSLFNVTRVDVGFRVDSLDGLFDRAGAQRLCAGALGRAVRAPRRGSRAAFPASRRVATAAVALLDNSNWNSQRRGRRLSKRAPARTRTPP